MIADGRTVPREEIVRTGICVIGAGPCGITIAKELGSAGHDVLMVERGPADRTAPPADSDTALNIGIPYGVDESRSFELGGAAHKWGAQTPLGDGFGRLRALDSEDFMVRSWIPNSGWPFGRDHLLPFYRRAREVFDGSQFRDLPDDDPNLWEGPFSDATGRIKMRAFDFVNPAVFPGELKGWLERSDNVHVLTNSAAVDVRCDETPTSVSGVMISTARDHGFLVKASHAYVLATGGIENPRLLLASRRRQTNGLGNANDLVGRFFMEHPHFDSGRMVPFSSTVFSQTDHYDIYLHNGWPTQRKYSLNEEVVQREHLNRSAFRFDAKPIDLRFHTLRYSESANRSLKDLRGLRQALTRGERPSADTRSLLRSAVLGGHHIARHALLRATVQTGQRLHLKRYTEPQVLWIRGMSEQVPNPDSRVSLTERLDSLGVPIATLNWRFSEQDLRSMWRSQQLLGKALQEMGHRHVESMLEEESLPPGLSGGHHHLGTTRMHDSPRKGVVDRDCQLHGVNNLYVAGSSVFPTGGYANPTWTILAMAIRLADHLRAKLR